MWKYVDVEIYVQGNNYAILAIELQKQPQLFCLKSFVLFIQAGVLIWKKFHPGFRDFGCKNFISVAGPEEGESGKARSHKPSETGWPGSYEGTLGQKGNTRAGKPHLWLPGASKFCSWPSENGRLEVWSATISSFFHIVWSQSACFDTCKVYHWLSKQYR